MFYLTNPKHTNLDIETPWLKIFLSCVQSLFVKEINKHNVTYRYITTLSNHGDYSLISTKDKFLNFFYLVDFGEDDYCDTIVKKSI